MIDLFLDSRSVRILESLIEDDFLSVKQISEDLSISRRSIYYAFDNINQWLESRNLPIIQNKRGKGYYLEEKDLYLDVLKKVDVETYLTQEERQSLLVCLLLMSEHKISIETLMETLEVSRNSVFSDLRVVKAQFDLYDLELIYDNQRGYYVTGSELQRRSLFLQQFYIILNLVMEGKIKNRLKYAFLDRTQILYIHAKLKQIESKLKTEYVDNSLLGLAALIQVVLKQGTEIINEDLFKEKLENEKEYIYLHEYFSSMSKSNLKYFTIHLISSRTQLVKSRKIVRANYDLANNMVESFENLAAVRFKNKSLLIKQISNHLSTSYYRYKYGITHMNPLLSQIKEKYPYEFYLTDKACDILRETYKMPVNEDEVAYITLYFASFLVRRSFSRDKIVVHVVCPSGVSTSLLLKTELEYLHSKIHVASLMSTATFRQGKFNSGDLIISTVDLNTQREYIKVNPVLSKSDKQKILSYLPTEEVEIFTPKVGDIVEIIKPYLKEKDLAEVNLKLERYLIHEYQIQEKTSLNMMDVLKQENILIQKTAETWQKAVYQASIPLLEASIIEERYIDAIIEAIDQYGAYMVIEGGFMFAHASFDDGVHGMGLSFMKLMDPVCIGKEKIDKIFVLSTPDQKQHLGIVKDLYKIFTDGDIKNKLDTSNSVEELYDVFDQSFT